MPVPNVDNIERLLNDAEALRESVRAEHDACFGDEADMTRSHLADALVRLEDAHHFLQEAISATKNPTK